ncbi:hypothetical protein [Paraburkholderia phytofirmans]|uniref:Uncharacterized protein n=1 Tax=Paraburkholderia phytofirmans TaxID=261302 RepID=A0ABW9BH02_9BURK
MLIEISAASQVSDAAQKLRDKVRGLADRRHDKAWSTPGGNRAVHETYVLRGREHDIYVGIHEDGSRVDTYAHLFLLLEHGAKPASTLSPNAEINVSKSGSKGPGGVFAVDGDAIVVCRRPTFNSFRGKIRKLDTLGFLGSLAIPIRSGKQEEKVLPVVSLDSPTFIDDIETFVLRALAIKEHFKSAGVKDRGVPPVDVDRIAEKWPWNDNSEFEGVKTLDVRPSVSYEYSHGPLCNRLSKTLRGWATERFHVRGTQNIDTAIVGSDGLAKVIFEVKTSGSLSEQLYKAIGQLFHYRSKRGDDGTILCLVLPGEVKPDAKHANVFFETLGIHVFYESSPGEYELSDGSPLGGFLDEALL